MNNFRWVCMGVVLLASAWCRADVGLLDIAPQIEEVATSRLDEPRAAMDVTMAAHRLGPPAIPCILPLLKHRNRDVRELATSILCYMDGFNEDHLDALILASRQGNERTAMAIARVGTPRAIAFLTDELKRRKPASPFVHSAFVVLRDKGVPSLVRLIREERLGRESANAVVSIFVELNSRARSAVDPLTEFIAAREGERAATRCAVRALGAIGPVARRSASVLVELAQDDPRSYQEVVDAALLNMGAPEAMTVVVKYLAKGDDKAARDALDHLREKGQVTSEELIDPLIALVAGRRGNAESLLEAVYMLGRFDARTRRSLPVLLELAQEDPDTFGKSVDYVLLRMAVPEAVPGVLRRIEESAGDPIFCYEVSRLGEAAKAVGPALVRRLQDDRWDTRCHAANLLGYIGYSEAAGDLIELLDTDEDWRLVFAAAKSLGRLRVAEAVEPLTKLSQEHWYPLVRQAAEKAIQVIAGESTYELQTDPPVPPFGGNPYREFIEYYPTIFLPIPTVLDTQELGSGQPHVDSIGALDEEQLATLRYKAEMYHTETPWQVPDVGMEIDGGYLVASYRGEWGGEMAFIDAEGKGTVVADMYVRGIYRMACGVVIVGGKEPSLFKVWKEEDGTWQVRRWKVLPAEYRRSSLLANGDLCVDCYGGCVQVSPAGDIKMARWE